MLSRRVKVNFVVEYNAQNCYLISLNEVFKTTCDWMSSRITKKSWKVKLMHVVVIVIATIYVVTIDINIFIEIDVMSIINASTLESSKLNFNLKFIYSNDIIIYNKSNAIYSLATLIDEYQNLFIDKNITINISKAKWMSVNLKSNVVTKSTKIYFLKQKNRDVMNVIFNKLHAQDKLHYIIQSTLYSYSIFVVWRDTSKDRKGRSIIDIRDFNDITKSNNYSLLLQFDVTTTMTNFFYIFIVDAIDWFHQFNVRNVDRNKCTIINHRDQKKSNVVLMSYKDSSFYMQRQIDKILRSYKKFVKAYVDDIIIYSRSLSQHLTHLRKLFELFR